MFWGKALSVADMHEKANVDTLEKRRETHLITLMFIRSNDIKYLDSTPRTTRRADAKLLKFPNQKQID